MSSLPKHSYSRKRIYCAFRNILVHEREYVVRLGQPLPPHLPLQPEDTLLYFDDSGRLLASTKAGKLAFPTGADHTGGDAVYLFSCDEMRFFLCFEKPDAPAHFGSYTIRELRDQSGGKLLFPISFFRNNKKPIVLMEIFIDNYVQMRYNLFTLYKKYCIFCFMAISHKESAADVLSDFSSDCLKIPQEY